MDMLLAHAFGQNYTLPVPLWLFLFSAATAVVISFIFFALAVDEKTSAKTNRDVNKSIDVAKLAVAGKTIGLLLLLTAIATDWNNQGSLGFSVTLFWIILLLGLTYLSAIFGNIWELINPFRTIFELLEKIPNKPLKPLFNYPSRLSYYPALLLYYGLIWLELLSAGFGVEPFNLSRLLLVYASVNVIYAFYFGKDVWFKYGEIFSVFFRLISKVSPVIIQDGKATLTKPFSQLIDKVPASFSLLVFVAFMLSSTGFDGLRETETFRNLSINLPDFLTNNYRLYQSVLLALSPFLLLSVYFIAMLLMKKIVKTPLSTMDMAKRFAYSLIPIAVVYNAAHYFPLLYLEAPAMIGYLLDPFDLGWSDAQIFVNPLGASTIWYSQILLIVAGHIIALYAAHKIALKMFNNRRDAVKSQYLMVVLMVLYTVGSLWIISQPLTTG